MFRLHEKSQDLTAANAASENGLASQDSTLRSLSSKFRCCVTCICDIFTSAVSLLLMDNLFFLQHLKVPCFLCRLNVILMLLMSRQQTHW